MTGTLFPTPYCIIHLRAGIRVLIESFSSLLAWSSGLSRELEMEESRFRGLLEYVNWPCVDAQVKYESHVMFWTACKIIHNQYENRCRFRPIYGNAYRLAAVLSALVYLSITNTNYQ